MNGQSIVVQSPKNMERILIVEDEEDIATLIAFNLERAGYSVDMVHDGK